MNSDRMGQALLWGMGLVHPPAALSHEELLQGIARAGRDPADPNAQALRRLADGLGSADSVVSQQELGTLSSRLLARR